MGINNFRNHYDASNNIKLETQDLLSNIRGKEHLFETDSYVDLIKTELNSFDRNIQKSVKNLMEQFQDSFSLWLNYLNICAGGNDGYIAIMYAGVISHTGIIRRSGNSKMYLELFRRKYVTLIAESVKSGTTHEGFTWNAITTMIYGEKEGLDSLIGRTILIGDMWPMSRLQSAGSTFKLLPWRLEVIHSDENSIILRNPQ
jgi:hypothetical protein